MCGIAGIQFKSDVATAVLDHARDHFAASLKHRGPDGFGAHRTARGVFANVRLAIVDRSGGDQPIYAAQGQRGIVYNGEVYNHEALRWELEPGHVFRTHVDTEVVLAAWLQRGEAALQQLNGMFALCIWDDRDGSFVLARDRFGAKPLYFYEDDRCFAFASELKTLLGLPGLDHSLDPVGFQDYLSYRYTLAPHTQFRRIKKLPAGHLLQFSNGQSSVRRFARVEMQEPTLSRPEGEYLEELDHLLDRAVKSQLMGEVPIGVLLSGGLDSSAIAAFVQRAGVNLKAYSIGFPEVNEFAFSRDVAQQFGMDYVEVCITQDELREGMDAVLGQLDEPIADPACFALSRLCQRVRDDVTVVLSGEGGDEMFAGYNHHQLALQTLPDRNQTFAHFFHQSANRVDANTWLRDKAMLPHHLRFRELFDGADTALNGMQTFELNTWMPENLMMKADKVLMAHSLEGRFPFLDLEVYRFASRLPQAMKLQPGSSKHVLRKLMASRLPRSVIDRRKMGFTVPPAFFLAKLKDRLLDAIARLRSEPVAEVLDLDAVTALVHRFYAAQEPDVLKVWNIAVLVLWWADVYPTYRATPAASPANVVGEGVRDRLTVYTVLLGQKEQLGNPLLHLPPGAATDLELDFVCITDNRALTSPVWRFEFLEAHHLPAEKLSRRAKAMPHEYFPDSQHSLYIDNTVVLRRLPQRCDLQTARPYLLRAFQHAERSSLEEEAAAVVSHGYDDVATICTQLDHYASVMPLNEIRPLTTATVLLRSHHSEPVREFGRLWWESILAFSKRDQLSFDFARKQAGVNLEYLPGFTHANDFIHWNGGVDRRRVRASFDAKRYAWLHRDDAEAQRNPRAHYLAHPERRDDAYRRSLPLLEFSCFQHKSSLGSHVSPRRHMADALEALLLAHKHGPCRYLIVRIQGASSPRCFDASEIDAATRALSTFMGAGAVGTVLDQPAQDLLADGRVYTSDQTPFDLVIMLGLEGTQLGAAVQKFIRLLRPEAGAWVAALTSPAALTEAAAAEQLVQRLLGVRTQTVMQASQHDSDREVLHNTVVGCSWVRSAVLAADGVA